MRDVLTGLAVAIITLLSIALVGPLLIDWSAQRARIETLLNPSGVTTTPVAPCSREGRGLKLDRVAGRGIPAVSPLAHVRGAD